jgi:hypothetical protein
LTCVGDCACQEVLPGQLRRRDPGQQLPGPESAIPLLDRANRRIQGLDHAQPVTQLTNRGQSELGVSAASGAPIRACQRFRFLPRILATR